MIPSPVLIRSVGQFHKHGTDDSSNLSPFIKKQADPGDRGRGVDGGGGGGDGGRRATLVVGDNNPTPTPPPPPPTPHPPPRTGERRVEHCQAKSAPEFQIQWPVLKYYLSPTGIRGCRAGWVLLLLLFFTSGRRSGVHMCGACDFLSV